MTKKSSSRITAPQMGRKTPSRASVKTSPSLEDDIALEPKNQTSATTSSLPSIYLKRNGHGPSVTTTYYLPEGWILLERYADQTGQTSFILQKKEGLLTRIRRFLGRC